MHPGENAPTGGLDIRGRRGELVDKGCDAAEVPAQLVLGLSVWLTGTARSHDRPEDAVQDVAGAVEGQVALQPPFAWPIRAGF